MHAHALPLGTHPCCRCCTLLLLLSQPSLFSLLELQGVDAGHVGGRTGLRELDGIYIDVKVVTLHQSTGSQRVGVGLMIWDLKLEGKVPADWVAKQGSGGLGSAHGQQGNDPALDYCVHFGLLALPGPCDHVKSNEQINK